jgi:formate-dependent nitrite reductase cytochrome c552 subunit
MPKLKYTQVFDGEWVMPMPQIGHKMACCDCGLIHRMDFAVLKGKVIFRAVRDNRATANRRRAKK